MLPSECKQQKPVQINLRLGIALALSLWVHLLLVLIILNHPGTSLKVDAEKPKETIEITIASKPKIQPTTTRSETSTSSQPVPIVSNPSLKPTLKPEIKLASAKKLQPKIKQSEVLIIKPIVKKAIARNLKPIKLQPEERLVKEQAKSLVEDVNSESLEQSAPVQAKPVQVKAGRSKRFKLEPVPEFKDDFQGLSTNYSKDSPDINDGPSSGAVRSKPDYGIHPGSILNINPKVFYPRQAMNKGYQGVVVVLIHISPDGHCSDVDLIKSSGHEELDNQVLGAVQHWRFSPPMRGNTPVAGTYKHTVIFGANEEVVDDFSTHWREAKVYPSK